MQWIDAVEMTAAGAAAGAINALVGSGTLVTFPVLLALGYPPVVANASNAVGLVPGSFAAAYGYRAELRTQRHLVPPLAAAALTGGITGALLLLILPAEAFRLAVPVLIALALVLIICQPWLVRALSRRAPHHPTAGPGTPGPTTAKPSTAKPSTANPSTAGPGTPGPGTPGPTTAGSTTAGPTTGGTTTAGTTTAGTTTAGTTTAGPTTAGGSSGRVGFGRGRPTVALVAGVFGAGMYGGYFGAALGVLLLGLLGTLLTADLQQANGLKNILAGVANSVAALVFILAGVVAWLPALLIGVGAVDGGMLAGRYGRRLPSAALRAVIVAVGVLAIVRMLV